MDRINWSVVIPAGCIIGACGLFWGRHGVGYALFVFGVLSGIAYYLSD